MRSRARARAQGAYRPGMGRAEFRSDADTTITRPTNRPPNPPIAPPNPPIARRLVGRMVGERSDWRVSPRPPRRAQPGHAAPSGRRLFMLHGACIHRLELVDYCLERRSRLDAGHAVLEQLLGVDPPVARVQPGDDAIDARVDFLGHSSDRKR